MPAAEWVRKGLAEHGPDLLQEMIAVLAQLLMSADVDAVCGASYGSGSLERVHRRNGYREILGVDVITSEDGAGWLAFLRSLVSRGLSGVQLAISDAH